MTGREGGYVVPADPANAVGGLKKKGAGSRSWILIDSSGQEVILDVDKYAIMHRVQIHARDLRILDPLLSYPSAILGRERAIVLNLEHIKAIITSEEVLLRDPLDDNVVPIVEDLRRRLKPVNANRDDNGDGKELVHHDVETSEEDDSPFEFRALEVALEAICSFLSARTIELETAVYPALDMLTSKISSRNLDRVRKLKSQMTRLTARVQKVRDELEQLLDDDDDMADLYLSRKLAGASPVSGSGAASWFLGSPTIGSKISRASRASVATVRGDENDVEELEMLLEAYFMQIDGTFNKLTTLREYIDNTEDYINIQLDNHRNQLIQGHETKLPLSTLIYVMLAAVRALSQLRNRMSVYLLFGSRNLWEGQVTLTAFCSYHATICELLDHTRVILGSYLMGLGALDACGVVKVMEKWDMC
ncbi:UNVERIFIED_CONTAM: Magnesium transporter MRS2-2 [Sesamum radiatum]|uniref:Magnesium transporter n=2 Tax=Sesamum radiatum TaxID=300843 RepID=A0AAW2SJW9_SESRA